MQLCRIIIMQLNRKSMKNSLKREKILDIFKNRDLLTANQVAQKLSEIDRATVYRNIALFVKQGVLREVNVKKGVSCYEINVEHDYHQHFICQECEKVIPVEINTDELKKLLPSNLDIADYELNLKGKCKECKQN